MAKDRVVRVYQEDWWPFQNLPAALRRFSEQTGIATELAWDRVGVGSIEKMFEEMLRSFTDDEPPFDLVCTDEVMLRRFAAEGRVLVLNELMARDGIALDDVTAATRAAVTLDGQVLGLPCVNVSNMLLYRRDLLERHGLPVPQSWDELKDVAGRLQDAVRRDGTARNSMASRPAARPAAATRSGPSRASLPPSAPPGSMPPAGRRRKATRTRRRLPPTSICCARWRRPTRRRSASSS